MTTQAAKNTEMAFPVQDGAPAIKSLGERGFLAFLAMIFLGAFNDNAFKIIVSFIAIGVAADSEAAGGLIALTGFIFSLPYLLFSGYAGWMADRFPKHQIMIASKLLEMLIMLGALVSLILQSLPFMMVLLFLLAVQSTILSPAKYGFLAEALSVEQLSRANGFTYLLTFSGIILGTVLGGLMWDQWPGLYLRIGFVLLTVSAVGLAASFYLVRLAPAAPHRAFSKNPFHEIIRAVPHIRHDKPLMTAMFGIAAFWCAGALVQMTGLLLGTDVLGLNNSTASLLQGLIGVGIALGSVTAGYLSFSHIEMRLVPVGALGVAVAALLIPLTTASFGGTSAVLGFIGFFGGVYLVPLQAFVQHRADPNEKGRILATVNVLDTIGMLGASGILWLMTKGLGLQAHYVFFAIGLITSIGGVISLRYWLSGKLTSKLTKK